MILFRCYILPISTMLLQLHTQFLSYQLFFLNKVISKIGFHTLAHWHIALIVTHFPILSLSSIAFWKKAISKLNAKECNSSRLYISSFSENGLEKLHHVDTATNAYLCSFKELAKMKLT